MEQDAPLLCGSLLQTICSIDTWFFEMKSANTSWPPGQAAPEVTGTHRMQVDRADVM